MEAVQIDSIVATARANPFLNCLSSKALESLLNLGRLFLVGSGEVLVRQGDRSTCAFLILEGELDVYVVTSFGEVTLATVGRGGLIGEIGVFAELPRTATVRARDAVKALRLEATDLQQAGNDEPALLRMVITRLGGQIGSFNQAIGLYSDAVSALESDNFDLSILDALRKPIPELMNFAQNFCRMAEQIVQRRARQAEMASAAAIQRAMLPETIPTDLVDGRFDIAPHMMPAREVGGDLYDVFPIDAAHLAITIGDVCGKGVPASLFMAVTQTVLRLAVRSAEDLSAKIATANALLCASNREMMFVTLFCGVLDYASGRLTYCNCGHNPPLLLRKGEAIFESLRASGPPLGIDDSIAYSAQTILLGPGDRLFLYTDGVTEAEDRFSNQFETSRLEAALLDSRHGSAQATVEHVVACVAAFANGTPQSDDITCLSLVRLDHDDFGSPDPKSS